MGHKKNERFIFGKTNPIRAAGELLSARRFAVVNPQRAQRGPAGVPECDGHQRPRSRARARAPSYEESHGANPRLTADKPSPSPTEPPP